MKTKLFSLLLMIVLTSSALLAHPPQKAQISYDKITGDLTIFIKHPVKDVTDHFLSIVIINLDGLKVHEFDYTSQSSPEGITIVYNMPGLESGAKIMVKATCNIFGKSTSFFKLN